MYLYDTSPELLDQQLNRIRNSPQPAHQAFIAAFDSYLNSGSYSTLPLPVIASDDYAVERLGMLAAGLYGGGNDVARKLAELALLALAKEPIVNFFLTGFFSQAANRDAKFLSSNLIDLADSLDIPRAVLATRIAVFCGALTFGWTGTPIHADDVQHSDYKLRIIVQQDRYTYHEMEAPATLNAVAPLERLFLDLDDATLSLALAESQHAAAGQLKLPGALIGTVALHRPQAARAWIELAATREIAGAQSWKYILKATARWDHEFNAALPMLSASERFEFLLFLHSLGRTASSSAMMEAATDPTQVNVSLALLFLATRDTAFETAFLGHLDRGTMPSYSGSEECFTVAAKMWESSGRRIFARLAELPFRQIDPSYSSHLHFVILATNAVRGLLAAGEVVPDTEARKWFHSLLEHTARNSKDQGEKARGASELWTVVSEIPTPAMFSELVDALGLSSKTLREIAISGLRKFPESEVIAAVLPKLASRKADERKGAAEMLASVKAGEAVTAALSQALAAESADSVRTALHAALTAQQGEAKPVAEKSQEAESSSAEEIEAGCKKNAKKWKLPGGRWLDIAKLPALQWKGGATVDPAVTAFLLSKQAALKSVSVSPDILPALEHIDRQGSAPFAAALVEGFLNSEQAAADRWALALGGLLGDNRIIPLLLARIPDWCENSRHKLAEYAAQAISLLPGNEPLMVLDTLANRYRNKFKNVGKACADAFMAAAKARGITTDELGDMVVPGFDFDEDGVRRFDWEGGGVSAELGPDFKLSWFDPETDKSWKTLPASAPESVQTEVKTLTKMLREAVKAQTPRLEMAMVRQRRWTPQRWRELYENHPLLRSFASRLVWGIYDASGSQMIRSFRRYPNGILADAAGAMEELAESDILIGIAHPLEMDAAALDAWRAHLARFKVTPPFAQIDRPVETMDPLHGNRREISLTNGRTVSAGTLRSRGEKRGWARGSVVDAGGISSYYKSYPGAGIEVILPTSGIWVSGDPMDEAELEAAYFVKADSVNRGSYVYGEPGPDDPSVLRFDAVPAVVWSETIADLKAILGEAAS